MGHLGLSPNIHSLDDPRDDFAFPMDVALEAIEFHDTAHVRLNFVLVTDVISRVPLQERLHRLLMSVARV